ncbi:MAG TPA: DUF892 family protein [Patescibacteria group bacterium]|nr:DUF892 family protein [Patescibacteria group bacterium]
MPQESVENLQDLLVIKLQALYDTEQQLVEALPKMATAATDEDLKKAFESHLEETRMHVKNLEQAFSELELTPEALPGNAIRGLVSDTEWCIDHIKNAKTLDAALVAAGQTAEHYEMAEYAAAQGFAVTMGHTQVETLLSENYLSEKEASEKLKGLAMAKLNDAANDVVEEESVIDKGKEFLGKLETGSV